MTDFSQGKRAELTYIITSVHTGDAQNVAIQTIKKLRPNGRWVGLTDNPAVVVSLLNTKSWFVCSAFKCEFWFPLKQVFVKNWGNLQNTCYVAMLIG